MYLTQMRLDQRSRRTLDALSAPCKFHGAIESAFPGPRRRCLWRVDSRQNQKFLLLLSDEKPDLTAAATQFAASADSWQTRDYSPLLERIATGSRWQFRLCANPTYSVSEAPGQRGRVCAHSTTEHQLQWLMRQSEKHGFLLKPDGFTVTGSKWYRFKKGGSGSNVTFLAVTYDGILEVSDPALFREALCRGIGPSKAYGAGLMTIVHAGGEHG